MTAFKKPLESAAKIRSAFGCALIAGSLLLAAAPVSAEALVQVQLKDAQGQPASGKVSLSGSDGKPVAGCVALAGHCDMANVPGGTYTVTVEPVKGIAPKPRKVMIPPSGKVALVVATS